MALRPVALRQVRQLWPIVSSLDEAVNPYSMRPSPASQGHELHLALHLPPAPGEAGRHVTLSPIKNIPPLQAQSLAPPGPVLRIWEEIGMDGWVRVTVTSR